MTWYKYLIFLSLSLFIYGCQNNASDAPSNNDFSYLDKDHLKNEEIVAADVEDENDILDFECTSVHVELVGSVINRSINNINTNILSLNEPFSITCTNNQKVTADNIILKTDDDLDLDLYLGGTVIAVGEISTSSHDKDKLPLEMNVIRIATIKGMVK